MAKSGQPENSASQISFFPEHTTPPDAKRSPDGGLTRPRKPIQTTPEEREEMHHNRGVKGAATVDSRWDLKRD